MHLILNASKTTNAHPIILNEYILSWCYLWSFTGWTNADIKGFVIKVYTFSSKIRTFRYRHRFDIMDNESDFFVFWHMQLYMSWYIRSFVGFTFLNILYFFSSTLVLTSSIDVVFILSIEKHLSFVPEFISIRCGDRYTKTYSSLYNLSNIHFTDGALKETSIMYIYVETSLWQALLWYAIWSMRTKGAG